MLSRWKLLLQRKSCLMIPKANHENFVMSKELAMIERECERYCPKPKPDPLAKVCIIGAGYDVGRIAALFLKQQKIIKILSLYDSNPDRYVLGVANDVAHIDTNTIIEAYQGRVYLKDALRDADVVLICGGNYVMPPCCNISDRDLFYQNMQYVRSAALAASQFAPDSIIAIQTPPVDCHFSLVKKTLEMVSAYDKRRLLGVNAINAMRANQLFCSIAGTDPATASIPVVCGTGRCTRVPVFSSGKCPNVPQAQTDCLTRLVREADDIICRVKCNREQGHLSIGFSTARFVINVMKGILEKPTTLDSALVEQKDPAKCYDMPICATPVTIGKGGIVEYAIPTLNDYERKLLECSRNNMDLFDVYPAGTRRSGTIRLGSCKTVFSVWHPLFTMLFLRLYVTLVI